MRIKIFNKRKQEFVKNEMYGDTYYIDLEGNVKKYTYSGDQFGDREQDINQDDYEVIFEGKVKRNITIHKPTEEEKRISDLMEMKESYFLNMLKEEKEK